MTDEDEIVDISKKEYYYLINLYNNELVLYRTHDNVYTYIPKYKKYTVLRDVGNKRMFANIVTENKSPTAAYPFLNKMIEYGLLVYEFEENGVEYYKLKKDSLYDFLQRTKLYVEVIRPLLVDNIHLFEQLE